jgi:isoleucyl-tRNA synthetase
VADELNVCELATLADAGDLVDVTAKASFRELGRRFGKRTPQVAAAIAAADAGALAVGLRNGTASIEVEGETVTLTPEEVVVTETPRAGWAVASEAGATLALDLEITPELRRAGLAREVVRLVQESRKAGGFEVSDRIELWWVAGGETADAVRAHAELIADEVLAVSFVAGEPPADIAPHRDADLGLTWYLRVAGE